MMLMLGAVRDDGAQYATAPPHMDEPLLSHGTFAGSPPMSASSSAFEHGTAGSPRSFVFPPPGSRRQQNKPPHVDSIGMSQTRSKLSDS